MKSDKNNQWEEFPDYYKQVIINPGVDKDADFLMQKVRVKPNTSATIHYHKKQTEIFIITKNQGHFIVNGRDILVREGNMLKVLPNEKHTVVNRSQDEFEFIAIKLNYDREDTYTD